MSIGPLRDRDGVEFLSFAEFRSRSDGAWWRELHAVVDGRQHVHFAVPDFYAREKHDAELAEYLAAQARTLAREAREGGRNETRT